MITLFSSFLKLILIVVVLNLYDEFVISISLNREKRSLGVKEWNYLWPNGRIPFIIDSEYNGVECKLIKQAMREWEKSTCLKFIARQNHIIHRDYIYFTKAEPECFTNGVGRRRTGKNNLNLGEKCIAKRIILHELGHAIGLYHEHERPDRDEYVKINIENVKIGNETERNFNKFSSKDINKLSEKYDYGSIMHYATNEFARNRSMDTITPLKFDTNEGGDIGRNDQISDIDIKGVNLLYNCSQCGKLLDRDTGSFEVDMNVINSTIVSNHCEWSIVAARGEQIIIEIISMSIFESGIDCTSDYLEFKDEFITGYNFLGRFCGKENSVQVISSSNSRVFVTYHANNANKEYYGFKIKYHKICESDINLTERNREYYLESPGFPNKYPSQKRCVWHIIAPFFRKLVIKFNYFKLEKSDNCMNDYVEIRDGGNYYSPLMGKYCNNTSPKEIWSSGYAMYVKFVSNDKIQDNGFTATVYLR